MYTSANTQNDKAYSSNFHYDERNHGREARKRIYAENLVVERCGASGVRQSALYSLLRFFKCLVYLQKNGASEIEKCGADIVVLQETKCGEWPAEIQRISAYPYKKLCVSKQRGGGYSGVGFLAKEKPIACHFGIGDQRFDDQGRLIHAEYEDFHIVGVYVPNSGEKLKNIDLREEWDALLRAKLVELDSQKPIILVGDLNVAHNKIGLFFKY